MGMLSAAASIRRLNKKGLPLFTVNDLGAVLGDENRQTLYKKIQRLEEKQILEKLTKGMYLFGLRAREVDEFTLANFLQQPSYVSLESAMCYHAIITGFTYEITSVSVKRPCRLEIRGRRYSYSRLKPELFWGWERSKDVLLATPEKALLDYLYLAQKGLRQLSWDEMDLSSLDQDRLRAWAKQMKVRLPQ